MNQRKGVYMLLFLRKLDKLGRQGHVEDMNGRKVRVSM